MESVKSDIKIDAFGISAHMDGLFGDNEALGTVFYQIYYCCH